MRDCVFRLYVIKAAPHLKAGDEPQFSTLSAVSLAETPPGPRTKVKSLARHLLAAGMVVPIGLSFGDLVAFAKLVKDVYSALGSVHSAPSELRSLRSSLLSLTKSLQILEDVALHSHSSLVPSPSASTAATKRLLFSTVSCAQHDSLDITQAAPLNGLRFELFTIRSALETIVINSQKHAKRLDTTSKSTLSQGWSRVIFSMVIAPQARTALAALDPHIRAVSTYIDALNLASNKKTDDKVQDILTRVSRVQDDVARLVNMTEGSIPKSPSPGDWRDGHVRFKEFGGKEWMIPIELCYLPSVSFGP